MHRLVGKKLGCVCKPLSCHGDILVELIKKFDLELDYRESSKEQLEDYLKRKGWTPPTLNISSRDIIEWWKDPIMPDCWQPYSEALLIQFNRDLLPNPFDGND